MMPLAEEQGISSFGSEEMQAMQDLDLRVCPRFSVIFWWDNVGEWDDHVGYSGIILGSFFMCLFGCFWKNPLQFKLTYPTKVWFSIGSIHDPLRLLKGVSNIRRMGQNYTKLIKTRIVIYIAVAFRGAIRIIKGIPCAAKDFFPQKVCPHNIWDSYRNGRNG